MNERLVQSFCNMVRIDSESGNEAPFIEHMKSVFEKELQAETTLDAYGNLVARVAAIGSGAALPIAFVCHADTVKPGVGIEPVIDEGIIRSKGETILGADDKAGLAEVLEAVRTATRRPTVEIILTRGEEVGLLGSKNLDVSLVQSKRAYAVDGGALNEVTIGGPTHINLDIVITGRAAHAGMKPEAGLSAIRVAADAIVQMPEGRIDEETTANLGIIEGGLVRNGVPETVRIKGECRSLKHEKALAQAAAMRKAFEDAAARAGAQVTIDEEIGYEAASLPEDAEVVKLAADAIRANGLEPMAKIITGGTDALVLMNRGIDAVALGYGGRDAHSTEEWIEIATMEQTVAILRTLIESAA